MRTLYQITRSQTAQQKAQAIAQAGDVFGGLSESSPVWQAIKDRFELAIAEANDLATSSTEANPAHFAGGEKWLRDLFQEFDDLRSGAWREWPEFTTTQKPKKQDDEDGDNE